MVIFKCAVLHADVACVGYNHCVCDLIANFHAFGRIRCLLNADLCRCVLGGHYCACLYFFRIISTDCRCICFNSVLDRTCINIVLSHCICISELCSLIRIKCKCLA